VIGVEADRLELQAWGRAAAIRRQELSAWIRRSLTETAERDEQRSSPLPHPRAGRMPSPKVSTKLSTNLSAPDLISADWNRMNRRVPA
jgi:hypothetical protein